MPPHVPHDYNERDLIEQFRSGDDHAFAIIYDQTFFDIYQYAKHWLNNAQDAEDITADTFIKLLKKRSEIVSLDNATGFLKLTARNACLDLLKHKKVQTAKEKDIIYQLANESEPDFSWIAVQEQYIKLVYAEVDKLPDKMKQIFLMSYRDGLKPAQIAEKLGITVRTVSNQKTNAIRLLKEALQHNPHLLLLLSVQFKLFDFSNYSSNFW